MREHTSGVISRRTLAKGAAWATPVAVTAAAAPALAASPAITWSHTTTWRWYLNSAPWCTTARDGLEINTAESGSGFTIANTSTSTSITNVSATFWFTRNDITWTRASGDSGCWSVPSLTGQSATLQGSDGVTRTYYAYLTTYTCTVTAVNGTTTLSAYRFRSQCYNVSDSDWAGAQWARRITAITIDGTAQTRTTGPFKIESSA